MIEFQGGRGMLFIPITQYNACAINAFLFYFISKKEMKAFEIPIFRQWKECF